MDVIGKVSEKKEILRATVVQEISRVRNSNNNANVISLGEEVAELKILLERQIVNTRSWKRKIRACQGRLKRILKRKSLSS